MVTVAEVLCDAFSRVREVVHDVSDGIDPAALLWQPDADANSIAWLLWHLSRIEDDHVAAAFGTEQAWTAGGWLERFGLPFDPADTGYGHGPGEVAAVRPSDPALLTGYYDAVSEITLRLLAGVTDDELGRIVDERWDPPVTLGVRLVSVIADDLQHVGQAAYLRGVFERR